MHQYRTHTCGELRSEHAGSTVRLSGWVHRKRDHGGLIFIDLRDHYGLTQCVLDPSSPVFAAVEQTRPEWVITLTGTVVARGDDTKNTNLPTGAIELAIKEFALISQAQELPLPVFGEPNYPEEIRLRNRFLDLRREKLHRNIMLRSHVIASLRRRMEAQGFTEFQTPILTASSPEGARDFLVPSRMHPGQFYALPQAPQQFKQLIMVAGFDRYFQIAPCFRDEDARADRSPGEFYQLDIEMSFVTQEDVFAAVEPVLHGVFEEFADGRTVPPRPFPRIPYSDSLLKYGTDKPDLRNPIEICDLTEFFALDAVTFNAFKKPIAAGGVVRAIPAPGAASQPRSFFDKLNEWARSDMGAPGLGYVILEEEAGALVGRGPIAKFIPGDILARMAVKANARAGDAVFFACDKPNQAAALAGAARMRIGEQLEICEKDIFRFCWIVDFPMFERDEATGKVDFAHNPFSMPQGGLEVLDSADQLGILAYQYDIVCNGIELSSGAVRNHRPDIMYRAFAIAGYDSATVDSRFGGMISAFKYGAPPHGGIAPGVDRIVMLLADEPNIREVILFPMNQQAQDLLMNAPAEVSPEQLRELHIRIALPPAVEKKKA
ncbi:MAG: aspartate--tRNA ligase [Alphaproteobacteria bacterium]